MRRSLIVAICWSCLLAVSAAQDARPSANASTLSGTVVKDPGSEPLKKVILQLIAEDQKVGGDYSATTDTDGHFQMENVLPGRYRVFLEKTGFVAVNARGRRSDLNTLTVTSGHNIDDLLFHMLSTSVITGRVTDEDGDPMASVRVVAFKKVPGKTRRESMGAEATNDQGEFRIPGLFPGQYLVVAMPPPDARDYVHRDKSAGPDNQPETRYLTTYYPGTFDSSQAAYVPLKAGEEMPVNFTLVPGHTYHVRGVVTNTASGKGNAVELVSRLGDSIHGGEVSPNGEFEIRGVPPGSYSLRATSTAEATVETARQDVTVASADLEGIKLAPWPAFRITGRLHVEGSLSGPPAQYSANLRQADVPEETGVFMAAEAFGENATVDRQGNFEWKNVHPGSYVVQVFGGNGKDNFFLKSAHVGDRPIDAGFTATGPMTLDIVISTRVGSIEGVVTSGDHQSSDSSTGESANGDKPVPNAIVIAVPEEKYRKISSRFGVGSSDQTGHFTIRDLAPGNYTLFAWQDLDDDLYYDPDFLKSQSGGAPVKIEEGSHQSVALKISTISDEWRE